MKRLLLLCFFIPVLLQAQLTPGNTEAYFRYVAGFLAHDSLQGREPGTAGEKTAASFISKELKRAGCVPLQCKKWLQPFDFKNPDSVSVHSTGNVLGKIETRSKKVIIIGAHYDHLGWGKYNSNALFQKGIHNGADDNASGVAMLLALAAWCNSHRNELQYDVVFAAWSAEEDGLFGSGHFLKSRLSDTANIACYINFDMLGRMNEVRPLLKTEGVLEYPAFEKLLGADSLAPFQVRKADKIFVDGSDNYNFEKRRIPSIAFSTGLSEYYHKPEDDANTLNYPGMVQIGTYLERFLAGLQQTPELRKSLKSGK